MYTIYDALEEAHTGKVEGPFHKTENLMASKLMYTVSYTTGFKSPPHKFESPWG